MQVSVGQEKESFKTMSYIDLWEMTIWGCRERLVLTIGDDRVAVWIVGHRIPGDLGLRVTGIQHTLTTIHEDAVSSGKRKIGNLIDHLANGEWSSTKHKQLVVHLVMVQPASVAGQFIATFAMLKE
jgi:hypothetical protein